MASKKDSKTFSKWIIRSYDFVALILFVLWLIGGVKWDARRVPFGPDSLKGLGILTLLGWWLPRLSDSLWLQTLRKVAAFVQSKRGGFAVALVFMFLALLDALARTYSFRYTLFDVGIYHQVLWSISHGHGFHVTISGAGNHFADHFSPVFVLPAAIMWLTDGAAWTLPVLNVFLMATGIAAWFYAAKKWLPAFFIPALFLFLFFFDSIWANLGWGFHETSILFPSLSWSLALFLTSETPSPRRQVAIAVTLLIATLSKEIYLLDGVLWSAAFFWYGRRRFTKTFQTFLFANMALALGLFYWFETQPKPYDKNYATHYYAYLGSSFGEVFSNLALHPLLVVQTIGLWQMLHFFFTLLLPFVGLPLLAIAGWKNFKSRDFFRSSLFFLICLVPQILSLLIATHPPLRSYRFHYVLGIWPILFFLFLIQLKKIYEYNPPRLARWIGLWLTMNILLLARDPVTEIYKSLDELEHFSDSSALWSKIPADASLAADERVGPWAASRLWATRWPTLYPFEEKCPQYIALLQEQRHEVHRCLVPGATPYLESKAFVVFQVTSHQEVFCGGSCQSP